MKTTKIIFSLVFALNNPSTIVQAQDMKNGSSGDSMINVHENFRLVGGPCEGCEAIFEYGNKVLTSVDTLPDFKNRGPKIKITGTVYRPGRIEPANGVILYIYHTNQRGIYPSKGGEKGWEKRHGYIRGWARTDSDGKYTFYTLKPGTYPSGNTPAHIHIILLEPGGRYYWLNSFHFEGDPLLTKQDRNNDSPRGGNDGILSLRKEGNLLAGCRDIVLGENIPGYE